VAVLLLLMMMMMMKSNQHGGHTNFPRLGDPNDT
jgi:hypothetical protein